MSEKPAEKPCARCRKPKPMAEFSKNKGAKDGLQAYCKPCAREYGRTWPKK